MKRIVCAFAFCVPAVLLAQPLAISTPPALAPATVNQAYSATLSATGGATPYTWHFELGGNPSPRLSLTSAGVLSGTPTSADLGTLSFPIQVTDASGTTVTQQFSLLVQSTTPLSLNTTGFTAGVVGLAYSLQLAGAGGVPPYKWNVLPAIVTFPVPGQVSPGLQLDSGSGLVTGSPTTAGMFSFTITLTDSAQGSVSKPYTLTVSAGGPLGITTMTLPNGIVGASYSQTLQSLGGVPPYKWSVATGTLPGGLTLDPILGVISGAPLTAATSSFTAQITDSAATPGTAKQALSIIVAAPAPLSVTASTLPGGIQGASYSQRIAATGGVPPYAWSVSAGTLPAGLSLSAASGAISGTPTTSGSSSFTVQATDNSAATKAKATQNFSILISQLTQLSVSAGNLAAGTVNTPYSQTLAANGGAPPYSWTVLAGSLPPGLLLSSAGTVSGVPTAAAAFGFTAQATDTTGGSALGAFSLTFAGAPLALVPLTLPSAVATVPYPSQVLSATGGAPPYTFSIVGSLPAGITLTNGVIGGTPGPTGTASFTIMATDSAGATATTPAQLAVRSSLPADLVVSTGALSFTLATGATGVPEPQAFTVASSITGSILSYQVTASPAAPWLTVLGGLNATASTPGGLSVALNSQAMTVAPSATPYTTTLSVTCLAPSPCAGSAQKINVSLTVSNPAPQLSLTKSLVALTVTATNGRANGQFGIQNIGGGLITLNSFGSPDPWVTITGLPSTIAPGPATYVTVGVSAAGLTPGLYRSTITVATSAGSFNLPVTLLYTTNLTMTLNPAGQQFGMSAGGATGNPAGTSEVLAGGTSTLNWTAATQPGAAWLKVTTAAGSSTPTAPGILSYSIDPVASAALTAGSYYGAIRVTSTQSANTPQDFLVVLNVAAAGSAADPDPEPGGLLFIATGAQILPAQSINLYAGSTTPVPYQAAAITASGSAWLSVTPASGSVSASAPGTPSISVTPIGLVPGVYRGLVTYQFSPSSLRSVNVTLLVPNLQGLLPFARPAAAVDSPRSGGTCAPVKLVASATGIPDNFAPQLAWPVPLAFQVTDDCGNNVPNGSVDVTFSNGDAALSLSPDPSNSGRYAGTWTPRGAMSQVTLTGSATAPGLTAARVQVSGKVTPNSAPVLTPGAMLNVFNPEIGGGIAPGMAVEIFGSNLAAGGTSTIASSLPFLTTLGNVSVVIGGIPAPLYYVSPGQINAEVPFELTPGGNYQVIVSANGALTVPDHFVSAPAAPGIAAYGSGGIIAQHLDGTLITAASPAMPAEIVVFYLAGLGSAMNQPATGNAAPAPPTGPVNPLVLTLNGTVTPALFVGLTPGTVGLYQIDFTVPAGTPDGNLVLTVSQAGAISNVTILPVHH